MFRNVKYASQEEGGGVQRSIAGGYRLQKRLSEGDQARGVPELWEAQGAGDFFYIKVWRKSGQDDAGVQALWNREVRGLTRLQGYPGAADLFVRLYDLRSDANGFYAILDAADRQPLDRLLQDRGKLSWLRNLSEFGRRRPLWEGVLRIAEALTVLHSEGTLHRALNTASIFSDSGGQGQFRLSGFEWSLRVAAPQGEGGRVRTRRRLLAPELDRNAQEYSVATDWFDFGLTAAEVFGVSVSQLRKRESVRSAVSGANFLRESERSLLLQLLSEDPDERLSNGEAVNQAIREIIRELGSVAIAAGRPLVLALRIGSNQDFTSAVARASKGAAPVGDPAAQANWVRWDLRGDVRVTARIRPTPHFILRGEKLEYIVRPWTTDRSTTWAVGFCDRVEHAPRAVAADSHYSLGTRRLEIVLFPTVRNAFNGYRDRGSPWEKTFPFGQVGRELEPHLKEVHDFFRLSQQLDTLLIAAQICPVEVIEVRRSSNETEITLTPREEPERNDLAQHLGLDRPSVQMKEWFKIGADAVTTDDDDDPDRDRYRLLERRTVDSDGSPVDWRFRRARPHVQGFRYTFSVDANIPVREGKAYIARDHNGVLSQVRRRHRAIEDLRSYEALLRLLSDPVGVGRDSGDPLPTIQGDIQLDDSKLKALAELWSRQPAFLVQGPPGTGKTTLIKGFASTLFGVDPSAQILISAHSHHTVDDVRRKIARMLDEQAPRSRPIILRLGARKPTEHDSGVVTDAMLRSLGDSPMASRAPFAIAKKLRALTAPDGRRDPDTDEEFRTMQNLVQEAANVTLATSNSRDLADLALRGRRFDWSLVEEAGKAHGFDMAAALQVSHRLVLIGDHHQLPPYNAKRFRDLFADQVRLRNAIMAGAQFAPGLVDVSIVETNDEPEAFGDRCERWRRMVTFFGDFFERSQGDEGAPNRLAATLTHQHRMHPEIAALVGRAFYPDEDQPGGTLLQSPPETHNAFAGPPPFRIETGGWLPEHRVVWCDVPWLQKREFAEGEIDGLFASDVEAQRVVEVLEQIRPRGATPCEVQILSPYNDQLDCIRRHLEDARARLDHMFEEPFALASEKRMGATVDEFQGSEADVVVVSLVRNNALAPWKSLGFLKEQNRMNVLLSRARHKLIIVGSWDFFGSRVTEGISDASEFYWLKRLTTVLADARTAGTLGFKDFGA